MGVVLGNGKWGYEERIWEGRKEGVWSVDGFPLNTGLFHMTLLIFLINRFCYFQQDQSS